MVPRRNASTIVSRSRCQRLKPVDTVTPLLIRSSTELGPDGFVCLFFFRRVSFTVRAFHPPGHVLLYERSHFPSPLTPCARGLSQKNSNTYSTKCCKRKPRSPLQIALEMAWSWKPALDHVSSTRSSNGRPCVCDLISVPNPADPKNLEN